MKLEQLKMLRDSYMKEATRPDGRKSTAGEYMRMCLDGGIDVVTSKDLVVFDDGNELVHAVCINEDMRSQASFPVKIITGNYDIIQEVETIMSQKNFEDFLNTGYMNGLISEEKKNAMIKWTRGIRNQAQQPMEAEPYFNTDPMIIPKADSKIEREGYVNTKAIIVAADGTVRNYSSTADALADMQDGDIVELTEDVYINSLNNDQSVAFTIKTPIKATIDLGGNSINVEDMNTAFKITDGQLNIKNGSINASGEVFRLDATEGGTPELILDEDVKIVSNTDCCIYIRGKAKVTSSATLTSKGEYCPIQGNGNLQNAGSEINIIGGSIASADVAIYQPQNGILNISNCYISGTSALYIKSGTVNIGEGAFITGNGDANAYIVNNNGCNATGDAIVVDFCGYPGGMPSINITGGVIGSINAKAIEAYDINGNTAPADAATNINISGGRFNTEFDASYLADGYVLENTSVGVYEVKAG